MVDYGRELAFGIFVIPDAGALPDVHAAVEAAERNGLDLIGIQDHPSPDRFAGGPNPDRDLLSGRCVPAAAPARGSGQGSREHRHSERRAVRTRTWRRRLLGRYRRLWGTPADARRGAGCARRGDLRHAAAVERGPLAGFRRRPLSAERRARGGRPRRMPSGSGSVSAGPRRWRYWGEPPTGGFLHCPGPRSRRWRPRTR